jgi:hypothetical protein
LTAAVRLGIRTFNSLVDAAPADDGPAVSSLVSQIPQVIAVERTRPVSRLLAAPLRRLVFG